MHSRFAFLAFTLLFAWPQLHAQNRIGTGAVEEIYLANCASCHGQRLEGGVGSSLINGQWKHGGSDAEIAASIRDGFPEQGMVAWRDTLDEAQIRALVVYIKEKTALAARAGGAAAARPSTAGVFETADHRFTLEKVGEADGILWSMDFMPDGAIIATQRDGLLWLFRHGERIGPISGTPAVWQNGQGGLLEVALHPNYKDNGWIYLSYSESTGAKDNGREAGMTAVIRGRIRDGRWVDQETLFSAAPEFHSSAGAHFGSRFVFEDGYLFFGIGDRGRMEQAQMLDRPNGKIHRIHDDGRVPVDNPFRDTPGALPTIWSYGHRNPQGLALRPGTSELWEAEHGPRGGDEVNRVLPGRNYGWPDITYGINYNGRPITDKTEQEGMEQPAHFWVPSIAVCGIDFYEGDSFPAWRGNLFASGLASEELRRLRLDGDRIVEDEIVFKGLGRIRDVVSGPDGLLYVSLNRGEPRRGAIYRLVPVQP